MCHACEIAFDVNHKSIGLQHEAPNLRQATIHTYILVYLNERSVTLFGHTRLRVRAHDMAQACFKL